MGIHITANRVQVSKEITLNDLHEMDTIPVINHIQIANYIDNNSLKMINDYIAQRDPHISFRVYRFDKTICNLQFLKYLKDIRNLSIDALPTVESLELLGYLESLEKLRIHTDDLNDIVFLDQVSLNLSDLTLVTQKEKTQIDLSILERFPNLRSLFLYKVKDDLNKLTRIKNLQSLTLNAISLPTLDFLNNTKVAKLSIGYITDCDLSQIYGNNQINSLELNSIRKIKEVEVIKNLPNLSYCKINRLSQLERIPELNNHNSLEYLTLDTLSKLKDISNLEFAPNLKYLKIYQAKALEPNDICQILNNKNLLKVKCTTGSIKKDRAIEALLTERGLNYSPR